MRMPRRSKNLVRRPHVGKAHFGALRDLPFGVSGLYSLGNLVGCLAFQPKFCPEFVIRQYSSYGLWVETNGSSKLRVIDDGTHLSRSERGRDSKPAHDHTQKSVIPLVRGLVTRRGKNPDGCAIRNSLRGRALGQRNFGVSSHHVLAERRGLRLLCLPSRRTHAHQQPKQNILISFSFSVNFPSELTLI